MILIELQYGCTDSAFMALQGEWAGDLDENELYWLTISTSDENADLDCFDLRKMAVAHA